MQYEVCEDHQEDTWKGAVLVVNLLQCKHTTAAYITNCQANSSGQFLTLNCNFDHPIYLAEGVSNASSSDSKLPFSLVTGADVYKDLLSLDPYILHSSIDSPNEDRISIEN